MENEPLEINEDEKDYNLLIESLQIKINQKYNNNLKVQGKLLHETKNINIFYYIFIYKSTEINPFEADIEMSVEFIENEPPYVQIMTNFLEPSLYDLKNYFKCLTKRSDYVFNYKYLGKCQIVFQDLISNIQFFLNHLFNCELLKTFIYFGEYDLNHIYHINNFLKNDEIVDFFRVNRIVNENLFNNILYIIITELYLLVFEPENNNKSLGKILFHKKLSEISINFEEVYLLSDKKIKKRLKLIIEDIKKGILFKEKYNENYINEKIRIVREDYNWNEINNLNTTNLYKSINDKEITKQNKENKKDKDEDNSINSAKTWNNLSVVNKNNKFCTFCYKFEFIFVNKNENDDNIQKEYDYFKRISIKKLVITKKKYKILIFPYWLLFNQLNNINANNYSLYENKDEINKLIEYNEKLCDKYCKGKNKIEKIISNNAINNIIFLCSEMCSSLINDDESINFYVEKLKKYSNMKK